MVSLLLVLSLAANPAEDGYADPGPAASPQAPPTSAGPAAAPADTTTGVVQGRVLSEESGDPLPSVLVEIGRGDAYRAAFTNDRGRYRLAGVPGGVWRLRVRAMDYTPLEVTVQVPAGQNLSVDLSLDLRPINLPTLEVLGLALPFMGRYDDGGRQLTPGSPAAAELRALEATPGLAELGLGQSADGSPPDPTNPSSLLFVRGATSDLKMVLLDGAPVFAPFHLGGLMDAMQPGVLDSSRVYLGGAPARYNGGLSYILDLETRPGRVDRTRFSGQAGLLSSRAQVEGPVGKGAYYVGVRGLHGLGAPGLTGSDLPYGYGDALFRTDVPLTDRDVIAATGFWNREAVTLEGTRGLQGKVHWGNVAGSIRYLHALDDGHVQVTASSGRFHTRLPVETAPLRLAQGSSLRSRLAVEVTRALDGIQLRYGTSVDHFGIALRRETSADGGFLADRVAGNDMMGGYADATLPVTEELTVRTGIRSDLFLPAVDLRFAPRFKAAWQVDSATTLSVSAGRYHQYVRAPESILSGDLVRWQETTLEGGGVLRDSELRSSLRLASASHVVIGWGFEPSDELGMGFEGFLKDFQNVPGDDDIRASGADAWLAWSSDQWTARAGYMISWVWGTTSATVDPGEVAGRHLFTGALQAPLPSDVTLDLELATSAGLPFTAIPTTGTQAPSSTGDDRARLARTSTGPTGGQTLFAGAPDGSYVRLDVKLSRTWSGTFLESAVRLTPYLKLLNALDRRDALFYQLDAERSLQPQSLGAVPLLPVAGVEWSM